MSAVEQLELIYECLDFNNKNGLVTDESDSITAYQRYFFNHVKEKLEISAVFFLRLPDGQPRIPLIYFYATDEHNSDSKIAELHKLAWNLGEAPLLFVVRPGELLIYNNYDISQCEGKPDFESGLIQSIRPVIDTLRNNSDLLNYHRSLFESGEYWKINSERFDIKNRVDISLLNNLKALRVRLLKNMSRTNSSISIVHSLLGRAIMIKYLEDRKDKLGNSVFPNGFFNSFLTGANSFVDVLCDKASTYKLFTFLQNKFNGDIFPITDEEISEISECELEIIRSFLSGDSDLGSGQMSLWPLYTFNIISIQLISNMYEMFFNLENDDYEKKKSGTYYTPYHLVELLLDEILPWEAEYKENLRILDPSCGSGSFLVEAYRRIVFQWHKANKVEQLNPNVLVGLLKKHIFGVDINKEAIRVASFSLCLLLCDYLEPKNLWLDLKFPTLKNANLYISDFFNARSGFNKQKYDMIVGNPPWGSYLTDDAKDYQTKTGHLIGDKQIAQLFAWKSSELCSKLGKVCLLLPSKGFLFNMSTTNTEFRKAFFSRINVTTVINFAGFSNVLFDSSTWPTIAVFFDSRKPKHDVPIVYCTPKPAYSIEDRRQFIIEPYDICHIRRENCTDSFIWKVSMWYSPRDYELIEKIKNSGKSLGEFTQFHRITKAEGFKAGNQSHNYNGYAEYLEVHPEDMQKYYLVKENLKLCSRDKYERTCEKNRIIFNAPHLLVKQSPVGNTFYAALLNYNAVFTHSILGFHGSERILKYLCLLMNSKVFAYYSILTSARIIERGELEACEILQFPVPLIDNEQYNEIEELYDLDKSHPENTSRIERYIYGLYSFSEIDVNLIEDGLDVTYDYIKRKRMSKALMPAEHNDIMQYSKSLHDIISASFGHGYFSISMYYSATSPLNVARVSLTGVGNGEVNILSSLETTEKLLDDLDKAMNFCNNQGTYVRRNAFVIQDMCMYFIKPNQKRYWLYSTACRDADQLYSRIMQRWSK